MIAAPWRDEAARSRRAVRLLVSVRSVAEAQIAAQAGVDFIDLKDPAAGALGGLPMGTITDIAASLRLHGNAGPVSATIGDLPMDDVAAILARVQAVAACGVDIVKVGIERGPLALPVIDALARCGRAVVPVFIADRGLDFAHVAHAASQGFAGVMADTADKQAGSLFDVLAEEDLHRFVGTVRAAGRMVGLAGALRAAHWPALSKLAPDFAGFRSEVCDGWRGGALQPQRLEALIRLAREPQAAPAAA